jgi:multicomponent Na+:H+ antiporter subunit D
VVALTLAAAVWLAVAVHSGGVVRLVLGGWSPPLGIALAADGLGAAFVVLTALVMAGVTAAARAEMTPQGAGPRAAFGFWPLMLLLWGR